MEGSHSPVLTTKAPNTLQSEMDQSYYDSDGQRHSSSFWPEYPSPSFATPLPHLPPASCPLGSSPQSSEPYCPCVAKRKNPHPQRPDREGHMPGTSAYPVEKYAKQSSNSGSSDDAKASCGATGGNGKAEGGCPEMHFVDKHKLQLINRVSNIDPILDELLEKKVIQEEAYAKIRALSTSQGKMRELFITSLRASDTCKDIFYEILKKNEAYLVDDLQGK